MPNCSVYGCKKRSGTSSLQKDGVTFHIFPRNPILRNAWKIFCNNKRTWDPKWTSVICSTHFLPSDFQVLANKRRRLVENSIPSITPGCICASHLLNIKPSYSTAGAESSAMLNTFTYLGESSSQQQQSSADSSHEATSVIKPGTIAGTSTSSSLRCSFCSSPLQKIYKCVQCEDLLLCDNCERSDRHPIHCVLRIASEDLYVKVKGTFPTLHRLFDMLLNEDEDSVDRDSEDENMRQECFENGECRSAAETDLNDEIRITSEVCSNVTDSTMVSETKDIISHRKVTGHKTCSRTTDTKHKSRKRKHNVVAGNTKKPTTAQEVNTTIDKTTIHLTETSPTHNDPLDIYYTIKIESEEDNTGNLESMNTTEVSAEHGIKQEVKEEPGDEDMPDKESAASVTYLCRAPNNTK